MNKDLLVASGIGFSLGLVAAIMLWVVPKVLPNKQEILKNKEIAEIISSPSTLSGLSEKTLILEVTDGSIVDTKNFTVKGTTNKGRFVVITTPNAFEIVKPDTNGFFTKEIELSKGGNHLVVVSYQNTETTKEELDIFYYPEKI
jgi:hypothetical protein